MRRAILVAAILLAVCCGQGCTSIDSDRMIRMGDGVDISVWVKRAHAPDASDRPRGTVVLVHPLLTDKRWFYDLGQYLAKRNWDVVWVDMRAHGRSGGEHFTWGVKERHDMKAVVDALLADDSICEPIFFCGASAGACVSIQYAAIDPRCRGVMAIASPASLRALSLFSSVAKLRQYAESADFDPDEADAVEAARRLNCPLMVIHGTWDTIVPIKHSRDIHEAAAGPKELIVEERHGHVLYIGRNRQMAEWLDRLTEMADQADGP